MGMEQVRHAAGNWKRLIGRGASHVGEAVSGAARSAKAKAEELGGKAKNFVKRHHPEDMDISGPTGHAASAKPGATMSDVAHANRSKRRRNYAGAAGIAGLAAGGIALARRAKKAQGTMSKLRGAASHAARKIASLSHRQKAAIGAGAAAAGGLTLMRRSRRKNKR